MDTSTVVDILNELLVAEHQSVARRLLESTMFVSRDTVSGARPVRQMAHQNQEHAEWLTGLILELGGEPGPRFGDPTSADLHLPGYSPRPAPADRWTRDAHAQVFTGGPASGFGAAGR